jgi:hypothetical protein
MKHEATEDEEMETGKGFGQPLVITRESSEAGGPSKAALDDPAPRQEYEATLGLGMLHHVEADGMAGSIGRRRAAALGLGPTPWDGRVLLDQVLPLELGPEGLGDRGLHRSCVR